MASLFGWALICSGMAGLLISVFAAEVRGLNPRQLSGLEIRGIPVPEGERKQARRLNVAFVVSLGVVVLGGLINWL